MMASMITASIFTQISICIIKEQELIIGPLAWDEARKVAGLRILNKTEVSFDTDPKEVLNRLVARYARLFGKASNEVCKEAAQDLVAQLPAEEVPAALK